MTLPLHIAQKLLALQQVQRLAASTLKHSVTEQLLNDGILVKQQQGRGRAFITLPSAAALHSYIANRFGINNLVDYIAIMGNHAASRANITEVASNSKTRLTRSFTGFLVASLQPLHCTINNTPITLQPQPGLFTFVSNYQHFSIPPNITVVGVENAANFNHLAKQAYLFTHINPLFVCRYPYSSDLLKWLQLLPNNYLHFGDIDFAGIAIFLNEYQRVLQQKASFFIPPGLKELLVKYGNRTLYNQQIETALNQANLSPQLQEVFTMLHEHKKGLEQEILIRE